MTVKQIYEDVIDKLTENAKEIGSSFPHIGIDGKWNNMEERDITWWTNGYWPGMLWQMYDDNVK